MKDSLEDKEYQELIKIIRYYIKLAQISENHLGRAFRPIYDELHKREYDKYSFLFQNTKLIVTR